jgi:hypothetical protein
MLWDVRNASTLSNRSVMSGAVPSNSLMIL